MSSVESVVGRLRGGAIVGSCIDLLPYEAADAAAVVRLRNITEVRYFLNQEQASTLDSQLAWTSAYLQRRNDIFWILKDKTGQVVGCNRLYDISADVLEKGSLIVDQEFARGLPIALEADLLALRCAFADFGVGHVLTRTRYDNVKMQSMNLRLGFREIGSEMLRGVQYTVHRLDKADFRPGPFENIVNHWSKRNERR
jgi:RimJ/RimL family protein N-acetyltransferase